jgi:hypothetical protein
LRHYPTIDIARIRTAFNFHATPFEQGFLSLLASLMEGRRQTTIDTDTAMVTVVDNGQTVQHPLDSAAGFAAASKGWVRAGWDAKDVYSFTWMGAPIIQMPEDMIRPG